MVKSFTFFDVLRFFGWFKLRCWSHWIPLNPQIFSPATLSLWFYLAEVTKKKNSINFWATSSGSPQIRRMIRDHLANFDHDRTLFTLNFRGIIAFYGPTWQFRLGNYSHLPRWIDPMLRRQPAGWLPAQQPTASCAACAASSAGEAPKDVNVQIHHG